ncbi:HesB/IscA family protein [Gemmatimonas sp.]|uniref:HesB/IscA family protein n=1 Tax=Gemmatimonas sp. TaxID=1962908 RepID=UPI003564DD5B
MSTMQQPEVMVVLTSTAATEVRKFMEAEGATPEQGGLRVSVTPGGCSGFKYGLVIEDKPAEDDTIFELEGIKLFIDPFSAPYLSGTTIDYVTSMQGSGFTFGNPQKTGGCGCGSSFSA